MAVWTPMGGEAMAASATLQLVDENRLTEVEVRYSYMERLVEDLSRVLHEQQRVIDVMSTRLERVEAMIVDAIDQPNQRLPHEKPPHY